jgi:hypothetical protein
MKAETMKAEIFRFPLSVFIFHNAFFTDLSGRWLFARPG